MKKIILFILCFGISAIFAFGQKTENPFSVGQKLKWESSARQNGEMVVTSVSGNKFTLDQTNVKNKGAGVVKLNGSLDDKGNVKITNSNWSEIWIGSFNAESVEGKINNRYTFKIKGLVVSNKKTEKEPARKFFFSVGEKLKWTTTAGQLGDMSVVSVDENNFTLSQTNIRNKRAGAVKLSGSLDDKGNVKITNSNWSEIWIGSFNAEGSAIKGKVNKGHDFTITREKTAYQTAADSPSAHGEGKGPIIVGKTLKWSTSARQNGTLKIVSIKNGKVAFDQINFKNRAAGAVRLDGEIKEDGKFYLFNKKWKETWVGTISKDKVEGKINNRYKFTIEE